MNEAQRSERRVDRLVGRLQRLLNLEVSCVLRSYEEVYWELAAARDEEMRAVREQIAKFEMIERAARAVTRWDWSSNDTDCVADIDALAKALELPPNA